MSGNECFQISLGHPKLIKMNRLYLGAVSGHLSGPDIGSAEFDGHRTLGSHLHANGW